MLIGKKYKIESDTFNYVLYQKGVSKVTKETYWRPMAYFSGVKNALDYLVDMGVRETGFKDFEDVIKKQNELHQLIKELKPI